MLRRVCSNFVTGVAVVTGRDGPEGTGLTINSFTSVSLDPPLVLLCIHRKSRMLGTLQRTGRFAINILAEHQQDVCRQFATADSRTITHVGTRAPLTGVPILRDALAYIECRVHREIDGGDHVIVLGEVLGLDVLGDGRPLTFFRNGHQALGAS
jgi:3-hydroxy-9,10-secoandrosta-1,3,5(10)-triene-9,17-dione monooxygenase reductase component